MTYPVPLREVKMTAFYRPPLEGSCQADRNEAWSTSNVAVATVSDTGLVTAVAAGTVTITATADGITDISVITVVVPAQPATRAEFAAMLVRALGLDSQDAAAQVVSKMRPEFGRAQGAIGAAAEAGLIAGYADGTFGASRQITRAEIAVILQRVVRKGLVPLATAEGVTFTDAGNIPVWAREGVVSAGMVGLMRGFPDSTFWAGSFAGRAEIAAILYRLVAQR